MTNAEHEQNDFIPQDSEYIQELMDMVSHQVGIILQYASVKRENGEDVEDPFEAVYEAMAESIATDIVLFSALKHLEERLGNVTQDS